MTVSIMKHIHPSIEFYTNDFTRLTPEYTASKDICISLAIYPTPKGPDNQLIKFGPGTELEMEQLLGFGKFKDFGQTMYNATNFVKNGGTMYFISPKPSDANYANIVVSAKVKKIKVQQVDEDGKPLFIADGGGTQTEDNSKPLNVDKLEIKYITTTLDEFSNDEQFSTLIDNGYVENDEDGYMVIPIYGIRAWGRGKYGNNVTVAMTNSNAETIQYAFQPYAMEVAEYDDGEERIENTYSAALYPNAINRFNAQEYMEVTINSAEKPSKLIRAEVSEFGVTKLTELMREYLTEAELKSVTKSIQTDILFAKDLKTNQHYDNIIIDDESVDITNGINLVGGSDGNIDTKLPTETRDANIISLLKSAWKGDIDDIIYNTTQFKYDVLFDANYPLEIKEAMHSYKNKRDNDGFFFRDIGIQPSCSAALTYRKETIGTLDDYNTSLVLFSGVIEDKDRVDIIVTGTYAYTSILPHHLLDVTIPEKLGQLFAGPMFGVVRGFKDIKPIPTLKDVKDELTRNRLNYCERVSMGGPHCIMGDKTSQFADSELSYIEHVLIKNKIRNVAEKVLTNYYFKNIDPSEEDPNSGLKLIKDDLERILSIEIGYMVSDLRLIFDQSEEQKTRKIVAVGIDVAYKQHAERYLVNINIHRYIK